MDVYKKWYKENEKSILEGLFTLLKFPSISTDKNHRQDCLDCAGWLKQTMQDMGLTTELLETSTLPLVYGEDLSNKGAPTLLIYGHYDVQPVDPLEEWDSKPFEPVVRDNTVYARGALDNKGQHYYTLMALKAFKEINGKYPINIKICLEGEEEIGSKGLAKALPSLKEKLKADYLLVPDVDLLGEDSPSINLGVRGILPFEIELIGSNSDLHSGSHGGLAYNPNRALCELIAKLWDESGRVAVDGFYDDVKELTHSEKEQLEMTLDREEYSKIFDIHAFSGERGYSSVEANWIRPTMEINGISGGYTGDGFKTVIPAKAKAKISCRLVSEQDPGVIQDQIKTFLEKNVQPGIKLKITFLEGGRAVRGSAESKLAKALTQSFSEMFSKKTANILSGGSIPVIAELVKEIGAELVLMGYGLPSDNIHAPNEHFGLDRFEKGVITVARMLELMGE